MKPKANTFEFSSYHTDLEHKSIRFYYQVGFENDKNIQFVETLTLPNRFNNLSENILFPIHLMLGISYWKAFCSKRILIKTGRLNQEQANFWNTVYRKGLGEFFYKNKLNPFELVQFPYDQKSSYEQPTMIDNQVDRALVGIGGGKDSVLVVELLKKIKYPQTGLYVATSDKQKLLEPMQKLMNIDSLIIKRQIDSKLLDLNAAGHAYNGHVPATAITPFIALLASSAFKYRYIVMANEQSANYGNLEYLGEMVNHQWSKSWEFEHLFRTYVEKFVTKEVRYFSLLHPLSELKIVQLFSKYQQYFSVFSSCNTNFRFANRGRRLIWCGECAKCAFVFVLLAAFLSKKEVLRIFNKNLFADQSLVNTYEQLLGIKDVKPFECVGTPEETKAAFYLAYQKKEYNEDLMMKMFANKVLPTIAKPEELVKRELTVGPLETIPEKFKSLFTTT